VRAKVMRTDLPEPKRFAHTPYADGVRPFSIGLKPVDPHDWLTPDGDLSAQLTEKHAILDTAGMDAFQAEPGTYAAQAEAANRIVEHLTTRCPATWRVGPDGAVTIRAGGSAITADPAAWRDAPLAFAARLVQDDLVLMRRGETGYRMVAAAVCFPSSWSLADKFGADMARIHANVPGYPGVMAGRVDRIFHHLGAGAPLQRTNWSIYGDDRLRHSLDKAAPVYSDTRAATPPEAMFIRCERQTLTRLPASGDILFTIRIHVDPIAALKAEADGPRLAAGLAERLAGLDADQLHYKGLTAARDDLVQVLRAIAAEGRL